MSADAAATVAKGRFRFGAFDFPCVVGRGGIVPAEAKREGDGATPAAVLPLREVFFRADRLACPKTLLPCRALGPDDGWCDDAADPAYNRPVKLPYSGRHERLWREDRVYDLIGVLGWNDAPVIPGRGSAVFLHLARPNGAPTEGCVALALPDLLAFLAAAPAGVRLDVRG